ncbi:MAG: glycosyltransferase family 4 protein [Verrucomicrobiota bacterium]
MHLLRIAFVADHRLGGMSRTMHFTTDELRQRGHQVTHWFSSDLDSPPLPRGFFHRFAVPWRIGRRLAGAVRRGSRYDVVEIHEPAAFHCVRQRAALPPLVVFSYGLEDRFHAAMLAYRRLKGLPIRFKQRWSHATISIPAGYAVRQAAQVVCSNSEDVEHLVSRGIPRERVRRHFSGVDAAFLEAGAALAPRPPGRGLLFLGGWYDRKGIRDLVPALTMLLDWHPDLPVTLAGGDVPEAAVLAAFPEGLRGRLQVIPRVENGPDLIRLYARHALFVLPSYFEGQPLVMIEAAAMKMAIVTTGICGMRDFIEDGRNGRLVAVGHPEALAGVLDSLVRDAAEVARLGEAAHRSAAAQTWAAAAAGLEEAYGAALRLGNPP